MLAVAAFPHVADGGVAEVLLGLGRWAVSVLLLQYVANFKTPIGSLTMLLVLTGYLFVSAVILLAGVQLDELARKKTARSRR